MLLATGSVRCTMNAKRHAADAQGALPDGCRRHACSTALPYHVRCAASPCRLYNLWLRVCRQVVQAPLGWADMGAVRERFSSPCPYL